MNNKTQYVPRSSPSDANTFDALPYAWWWKHADSWGYEPYKSVAVPRMERGNSVERGMSHLLKNGVTATTIAEAKAIVREDFIQRRSKTRSIALAEATLDNDELAEWRDLDLYVEGIAQALTSEIWRGANLGKLVGEQVGVKLDILTTLATQSWIGYIDFQFENGCVDLKSTKGIRGSMSSDHVLQTAFYQDALGGNLPQHCLYVAPVGLTPKGNVSKAKSWNLVRLSDAKHATGASRRPALATAMAAIYQMDTRMSKLMCIPRDPTQFRWDDELRNRAKKEWGIV